MLQSALQKVVLRSLGSATTTVLPHCLQEKVRDTAWHAVCSECFQYSRSQRGEQNFTRLSARFLTKTRVPQRRQRKERTVFPPASCVSGAAFYNSK